MRLRFSDNHAATMTVLKDLPEFWIAQPSSESARCYWNGDSGMQLIEKDGSMWERIPEWVDVTAVLTTNTLPNGRCNLFYPLAPDHSVSVINNPAFRLSVKRLPEYLNELRLQGRSEFQSSVVIVEKKDPEGGTR